MYCQEFWDALLAGKTGVQSLEGGIFSGMHTNIGAVIRGLMMKTDYFDIKEARRMSRSSQFGMVAARQAISEAKLEDGNVNRQEIGVFVGSSIGGYSAAEPFIKNHYDHVRMSPFSIPLSMNIGPGSNISIKYGFQGPLVNVDAACSTAAHSIGNAFQFDPQWKPAGGGGRRGGLPIFSSRSGGLGRLARRFHPGTTIQRKRAGRSARTAMAWCWVKGQGS